MAGDYNPDRHHRRSIRLQGYDYAQDGLYFVTICSHGMLPVFGEIIDGALQPSAIGQAVETEWLRTPRLRPQVVLDAHVVMPNHVHGLILIQRTDSASSVEDQPAERHRLFHVSQTLGAIVRGFKGASTNRARALSGSPDLVLWQRNFYEHIIRDERTLDRVRVYIDDNVRRWEEDRYHPTKM